jgi:PP-loop superfamily ATP-utilizing enzyme
MREQITTLTREQMINFGMSEQEISEYYNSLIVPTFEYTSGICNSSLFLFSPKKRVYRKSSERVKYPDEWDRKTIAKYKRYIYRSKSKSLKFELTHEEFYNLLYNSECKYCGSSDSITIDRIDSSKGYTKSNVQSCCNSCNILKTFLSEREFLKQIERVYKHIFM